MPHLIVTACERMADMGARCTPHGGQGRVSDRLADLLRIDIHPAMRYFEDFVDLQSHVPSIAGCPSASPHLSFRTGLPISPRLRNSSAGQVVTMGRGASRRGLASRSCGEGEFFVREIFHPGNINVQFIEIGRGVSRVRRRCKKDPSYAGPHTYSRGRGAGKPGRTWLPVDHPGNFSPRGPASTRSKQSNPGNHRRIPGR
jgi:hypothetical protein